MLKKVYEFNDMIWKFWKEFFGKGLEWIYIVFVENMVIVIFYGNLIFIEKFILSMMDGVEMVYMVRMKMI